MADQKPVKMTIPPSSDGVEFQQFQTSDTIAPEHGGTGKNLTDLSGQAGKYLKVNSGETGYEFDTPAGGGSVASVTGSGVDNTDPANPVVNARPYKSYAVLVNQSSESDPEVETLENNTGTTFTWTRDGEPGVYLITAASSVFTNKKTFLCVANGDGGYYVDILWLWESDTQLRIKTAQGGNLLDSVFVNCSIEIRVYP